MATAVSELLALALALAHDGDGTSPGTEAVESLVESADGSPTALMGAYALALSLARDMPYDTSNERTLSLITRALQRAVRLSGQRHAADGSDNLLRHIVDVAGQAAFAPDAVASRTAEVEDDLGHLRHDDAGGVPPASP